MGCSGNSICEDNDSNEAIIEAIKNFNETYMDKDEDNTEININSQVIFLFIIEQKGFISLCSLRLKNLIELQLNNNNIDNIDSFKIFYAPILKILDLSYNKIKNINIFKIVIFPLEELNLSNNLIDNIDVFAEDETLPKLKNILLDNNDIDYNEKTIINIITKLKKRIIINAEDNEDSFAESNTYNNLDIELKKLKTYKNENSFVSPHNDKNFEVAIKKLKTLNNRFNTNFGLFEKNVILKMKSIKFLSESDESIINEIEICLSNLKRSVIVFKNKPLYNVKIPKTKTLKNK